MLTAILSFSLLLIGIFGLIVSRRNVISMLIAVELLMLSANFHYAVLATLSDDGIPLVLFMVILTLAGVEASLGLAILICYSRLRGLITTSFISSLKG